MTGIFSTLIFVMRRSDSAVRGGGDGAEELDRKGQAEFVQDAGELDLIAIASDIDLLERELGGDAGVEVIADVAHRRG